MPITSEEREQVVSELKRFAHDLGLSDQQKEKLHHNFMEAREKLSEYMKKHPGTTKADMIAKVKEHRTELRQRVEHFLTADQLKKWDTEIAKAKEFLGQKLEA